MIKKLLYFQTQRWWCAFSILWTCGVADLHLSSCWIRIEFFQFTSQQISPLVVTWWTDLASVLSLTKGRVVGVGLSENRAEKRSSLQFSSFTTRMPFTFISDWGKMLEWGEQFFLDVSVRSTSALHSSFQTLWASFSRSHMEDAVRHPPKHAGRCWDMLWMCGWMHLEDLLRSSPTLRAHTYIGAHVGGLEAAGSSHPLRDWNCEGFIPQQTALWRGGVDGQIWKRAWEGEDGRRTWNRSREEKSNAHF